MKKDEKSKMSNIEKKPKRTRFEHLQVKKIDYQEKPSNIKMTLDTKQKI